MEGAYLRSEPLDLCREPRDLVAASRHISRLPMAFVSEAVEIRLTRPELPLEPRLARFEVGRGLPEPRLPSVPRHPARLLLQFIAPRNARNMQRGRNSMGCVARLMLRGGLKLRRLF
jgi:hypothetical protein